MAAEVKVLTHLAESQQRADLWLDWVDRHHKLERFKMTDTGHGWEVTAYVTDRAGGLPAEEHGQADPTPASQPAARPHSCAWCGTKLPAQTGRGRPRRYCSDACRSRAARERNPRPPACQLRAGDWTCARPAVAYLREPDPARPGRFKPWGFAAPACAECLPLVEAFAAKNGHTTVRQSIEDHRAELRARLSGEPTETADPHVALLEAYVQAVSQQLARTLMAEVAELHAWRGDQGQLTACLTLDQDNGIDGPWLLVWAEETGWRASPLDPRTDREIYTTHLHRGGLLPTPDRVLAWISEEVLPGRAVHRKPKLFRRAGDGDTLLDQLRAAAGQDEPPSHREGRTAGAHSASRIRAAR